MINCDTCERSIDKFQSFKGELELSFQGKILSFLGDDYLKPKYSVELSICENCAIAIMNKHKGLLVNG